MLKIKVDYFNGNEWKEVNEEWLEGIANIENIKEIYKEGKYIKVVYKGDKEVYYQDVHGTWGTPTVFK